MVHERKDPCHLARHGLLCFLSLFINNVSIHHSVIMTFSDPVKISDDNLLMCEKHEQFPSS